MREQHGAHTRRSALAICCLAAAAAGCGGHRAAPPKPTPAAERAVAGRFARAVLHGDAPTALTLLANPEDGALEGVVRASAALWTRRDAVVRPKPTHAGDRWTFRYSGTRVRGDGAYEQRTGRLVVVIRGVAAGARVEFFAFTREVTVLRTHHDSQLLPSVR